MEDERKILILSEELYKKDKLINNLLPKSMIGVEAGQKTKDVYLACKAFREFLDRLVLRYGELIESERKIQDEKLIEQGFLSKAQTDFVNRTEAFHQQVYATISSFINFLKKSAPSEFKKDMPHKSVERFLSYLEKRVPSLNKQTKNVELLELSRTLRVDYINHTQQKKSYDWSTFANARNECYVIYYRSSPSGKRVDISRYVNVSPLKIFTSRKVEEVFVSPHHSLVINALYQIIIEVLLYLKNNEKL